MPVPAMLIREWCHLFIVGIPSGGSTERSMTPRNNRKLRRFAIQLPCTVGSHAHRSEGTVLNLSRQGCAVTLVEPPSVSSHLALWIDLLEGLAPVEIELAGVRWISEQRCGFEFIRIAPEMLSRLGSFISVLEHTP
jgi:hypothetical protein